MKKIILCCLLLMPFCTGLGCGKKFGSDSTLTNSNPNPNYPLAGWTLVWNDEFDGPSIDPTKWGYETGGSGWGNNELEYYTDRKENSFIENGSLVIQALKENYSGKSYTSARMVTKYRGDWLYGRFEIRAKLPYGVGTWPAIWMLPTDWAYGGWPASGEVDIMEHVGYDPNVIHGSTHCQKYYFKIGTQKTATIKETNVFSEFHTYGVEWFPEKIDFFVDSVKYFSSTNDSTGWEAWPFDKRFHLLLNIAIGGDWGGAKGVDNSIFPQRMYIDYVRVYKKAQ
ncbi:MAG: glycoside hydrolase family 16 protein [Bacteroidota bacterium]|nr:glycoside hydrolase family 16 protein [Bacteroidota bacterium]